MITHKTEITVEIPIKVEVEWYTDHYEPEGKQFTEVEDIMPLELTYQKIIGKIKEKYTYEEIIEMIKEAESAK